ncbi:MAG: MerR family transcriptional regulator [Clostridia bacterium]|nr:MerR family transcriptional regulator [Clostridia bacterium]
MKISEVSKITGLTKKAIRYYEMKGLITPAEDEAGHKNYTNDIADSLQLIAFLRNLDMSVQDIVSYLAAADKSKVLNQHISSINYKIVQFKNIKDLTVSLLENPSNYKSLNMELERVNRSNTDYLLNKLKKLFPTAFGEYIIVHFREYLAEPVDSIEKNEALNKIVSFLDEFDESPIQEHIDMLLNAITKEEMADISYDLDYSMKNLNINLDNQDEVKKFRMFIQASKEKMNVSLKNYPDIAKANKAVLAYLSEVGYKEHFIDNLRILSPKYDQYLAYFENLSNILQ